MHPTIFVSFLIEQSGKDDHFKQQLARCVELREVILKLFFIIKQPK